MKNLIHKLGTGLDLLITWPLYWLSCLMPRDKYRWVFIGWHRGTTSEIFADNTKYLFLTASQTTENLRPIWLAKDRYLAATLQAAGYEAYYEHSLKGIWSALRAGTTVIDAFLQRNNFRLSGRSTLVQLLHGKGMKKKGYGEAPLRVQKYICAPSTFAAELLPTVFTAGSQIHITGYPRNDIFFQPIAGAEIGTIPELATELHHQQARCVLYAPTFRRGSKTYDLEAILAPEKLVPFLQTENIHLYISLHPKYRAQTRDITLPGITFIEESDLYPLLPYFDTLVTDYSSIFTDYLLLDRPLIFYAYDLENYEQTEGLSIDYQTMTPGIKVTTPDELLAALGTAHDSYREARAQARDLYHYFKNGGAGQRILLTLNQEEQLGLKFKRATSSS